MLAGTGSGRATGISAVRKRAAKIAAIARGRADRLRRLNRGRIDGYCIPERVPCESATFQAKCSVVTFVRLLVLSEGRRKPLEINVWTKGGLAWVEILAYEPDLSGPSSPQRCSQPTGKHIRKGKRRAQWAIRIIISSTRVLVPGSVSGVKCVLWLGGDAPGHRCRPEGRRSTTRRS